MSTRKIITSIIAIATIAGVIVTLGIIKLASIQEDTCKRTIENSLALFLKKTETQNQMYSSEEWAEINETEKDRLIRYVKKNTYSECRDYTHYLDGKNTDGNPLGIMVRDQRSGGLEVKLVPRE